MPGQEHISHGVGVDTIAPNPYSAPTPVENFRWDRADGYLKWDKALDSELEDGHYIIQYTDVSTEPTESDWLDFASDGGKKLQSSISETTGTFQDTAGIPGRKYRIKKVTSAANGSVSSIWVGVDIEYEATTDRCYVMLYVKTLKIEVDTSFSLEARLNVANAVKTVTYMFKTAIPVMPMTVSVEKESGLLIVPLIPTALLTNGTDDAGAPIYVKYNFKLKGSGQIEKKWMDLTVPQQASAYLLDLE